MNGLKKEGHDICCCDDYIVAPNEWREIKEEEKTACAVINKSL